MSLLLEMFVMWKTMMFSIRPLITSSAALLAIPVLKT